MRQDPSNPYLFYTVDDEHITIVAKAKKISPLVEGGGPPTFLAHPPDFKKNQRVFEFTRPTRPTSMRRVDLQLRGGREGARYDVTLSSSEGDTATIPPVKRVPGLTLQHLGMLFQKNEEVQP